MRDNALVRRNLFFLAEQFFQQPGQFLAAGRQAFVVVPAKTPPEIVAKLHAELRKALQSPDVRERITFDGAEVIGGSSAEFGEYIKSEFNRFGKIIRATGAQPQ